jgi:DNA (cytosine-5)-methyltransferase 1
VWLYVPDEPPEVGPEDIALLSLCSGAAMLNEGVKAGLELVSGRRVVTVGYCEREAYAAAILVARMEDACLDQAPIWDDLESFPCGLYRDRVDCLVAGFPCQPWSVAGKRKGREDDRWLWPFIAGIVRDVGPRLVVLENVPGLLVHDGLGAVLGDLAQMGFNAEWGVLSAAAVGAGHRRERVFVVADAEGRGGRQAERGESERERSCEAGEAQPDADSARQQGRRVEGSEPLSDLPLLAPSLYDEERWVGMLDNAELAWLWPATEPGMGVLVHGMALVVDESRAAQLRLTGNGVVALQAAVAVVELCRRLGIGRA